MPIRDTDPQRASSDEKVLIMADLEPLYCLLMQLSSDVSRGIIGDAVSIAVSNNAKLQFSDIYRLSDMLFGKLDSLYSSLKPGGSLTVHLVDMINYDCHACLKQQLTADLVLILRCCVITVHLLEFNMASSLNKCRLLVEMLRDLCCPHCILALPSCNETDESHNARVSDTKETVLYECTNRSLGLCCSGISNSANDFRCLFIEIFIDELLVRHYFREHFRLTDYLFGASYKLFASDSSFTDAGSLFELVSAHFILSVDNVKDFSRFHDSLVWSRSRDKMDDRALQFSLNAAANLLSTAAIYYAPLLLQTHIFLLSSRSIGTSVSPINKKSGIIQLSKCIVTFDQSLKFYRFLLPSFPLQNDYFKVKSEPISYFPKRCTSKSCLHPSFEHYVKQDTIDKIELHILKLNEFYDQFSDSVTITSKEDKIFNIMTYATQNLDIIQKHYREDASLFLRYIMFVISNETGSSTSIKIEDTNWHLIYCFIALLKLMSASVLQIALALKGKEGSDCLKTLEDNILQREYDSISGTMYSFVHCFENQLVLSDAYDHMKKYSASNKGTVLMLAHFLRLLICSADYGLIFLWKGCIFMIIALLNLLIFEEGNLDLLRPAFGYDDMFIIQQFPFSKIPKQLSCRKSSFTIASNLQKIRTLYSLDKPLYLTYEVRGSDTGTSSTNEAQDESFPGRSIVKSQMDGDLCMVDWGWRNAEFVLACAGCDESDVNDLADFVVCNPDKDYAIWMRNKQKFSKWAAEKTAVAMRHKRMKKLIKMRRQKQND